MWLAKALNAGLNLIQRNHGRRAQAGDIEHAVRVFETARQALKFECENFSTSSKLPH